VKAVCQGNFSASHFGHAYHRFASPALRHWPYNASTKYASWTVEKKVCSKLWPMSKSPGVCRWCNFHYDIRSDITSRMDGNAEKYVNGWNV